MKAATTAGPAHLPTRAAHGVGEKVEGEDDQVAGRKNCHIKKHCDSQEAASVSRMTAGGPQTGLESQEAWSPRPVFYALLATPGT